MSYHILFEGVCFVISYPTHIRNAYVAEIFLRNKKREKAPNAGGGSKAEEAVHNFVHADKVTTNSSTD